MTTMQVTPQMFIDGRWEQGEETRPPIDVRNPATEAVLATVPDATRGDTVRAIEAARRAFDEGPWPRLKPRERADVMLRMAEVMERRRSEILDLLVAEAGTPRRFVEAGQFRIPMEHFVDTAERIVAGHEPVKGIPPVVANGMVGQGAVIEEPIGVAALITAFNFPFHLNLMKLGPALGAGCTTILKPSPLTPLVALLMGEVAEEAGLPAGVLNIVSGDVEAGMELSSHPAVDIVSFTGSDRVGKEILVQAAPTLKKVVLELGGKSANIILADADLERVVPGVVFHMTWQCGQGCSLQTRTLVDGAIHDELVSRVSDALAQVEIADPDNEGSMLGPLISAQQRDRVEGYIRSGREEGAVVAFGGGRPPGLDSGYFVEPTLFAGCANGMTIAQEEIFGPVNAVIPFSGIDEAIKLANDTRYGLAAGVWSGDPTVAYDVARQMRAGFVTVNGGSGGVSPYGPYGGYKQSGLGREFGEHGFKEFLELKTLGWPAIVT